MSDYLDWDQLYEEWAEDKSIREIEEMEARADIERKRIEEQDG